MHDEPAQSSIHDLFTQNGQAERISETDALS
jgi:hypothetical protein